MTIGMVLRCAAERAGGATVGAHAGKGIFEEPMLILGEGSATEVPGSEGKVERNGTFKVEIPTAAAGAYTLCLHQGPSNMFLGTISLAVAGELKFEGVLGPMTLVAPYFVIHAGTSCSDPDAYVSGLTI